jgi:TRAP-type transport system periplasmic protein
MKLRTAISTAFVAYLAAMSSGVAAETMRFGHVGGPGSLYEETAKTFAACINETLAGEIELQTFGASQLGQDKELLQKLKLNQVDFTLSGSVMSSVDETFGIFEMPYIIRDRDHMRRVQGALWDTFQGAANTHGYQLISLAENGFRHITNNVRPINVPADLADLKLRTPNGVWRVKMFQSYGANPSPMAFADVFTALKTGTMDGQENPFVMITSAKFHEVQKYLSITGHVYAPAFIVMSKPRYDAMPDSQKSAVSDCGSKAQDFTYARAAELEVELLDTIKAAGVEVNEADKAAFVEASGAVYDEFAQTVLGGAEMIETVMGLAAAE